MALEKMRFDPEEGFLDTSAYPDPASEDEVREQLLRPSAQIRNYMNDVLLATLEGTEGAQHIGAQPGNGMLGENVQAQLDELAVKFDDIVSGVVPDGAITTAKLRNEAVTPPKMGFPVGVTWVSQMEPQNTDWAARGMKPGASWVRPAFTLANAVNNPTLTDATGWTAAGGTVVAATGVLTATGNGSATEVSATGACTITGSGTFAVFAEVQQTNSVASAVRLSCGGQTQEKQLTVNTWTPFCILMDTPGNLTVSATYPTAASSNGMAIQIRKAAVVNLTAPVDAAVEHMTLEYAEVYFLAQAAAASWYVPYRRWICTAENVWQMEQNDGRVMQYCLFPDSLSAEERAQVENNSDLKAQADACEANAKIGTITTSVRNTLGQKWALCNGDAVLQSEYPKAFEVLPETIGQSWTQITPSPSFNGIKKVKYLNGAYFAVGYAAGSSSGSSVIYRAGTIDGPWTQVYYAASGGCLYDIDYGNGYYVAISGQDASNTGVVYYSVDGITWSYVSYSNLGKGGYGNRIIAANGMFIAVGANTSNSVSIYKGTTPTNMAAVVSTGFTGTRFSDIVYALGKFAFIYINGSNGYARISTDGADWSTVYTLNEVYNATYEPSLVFLDGKFFWWHSNMSSLVYGNLSSGVGTYIPLPSSGLYALGYINNIYTFFMNGNLYTSPLIDGVKTKRPLAYLSSAPISNPIIVDNQVAIRSTSATLMRSTLDKACKLPEISVNEAYAYIKVR